MRGGGVGPWRLPLDRRVVRAAFLIVAVCGLLFLAGCILSEEPTEGARSGEHWPVFLGALMIGGVAAPLSGAVISVRLKKLPPILMLTAGLSDAVFVSERFQGIPGQPLIAVAAVLAFLMSLVLFAKLVHGIGNDGPRGQSRFP